MVREVIWKGKFESRLSPNEFSLLGFNVVTKKTENLWIKGFSVPAYSDRNK